MNPVLKYTSKYVERTCLLAPAAGEIDLWKKIGQ
jgi:hypothetical protein